MITRIRDYLSCHSKQATAVLLVLSAVLVLLIALQPVEQENVQKRMKLSIAENYHSRMQTEFDKIISGDSGSRQVYEISDSAQAAPMPDAACYGEAEDPAELSWLLEEAQELLDGQQMYFSTETEILPGSTIHYYLDETILAITWKQVFERTAFTFSEVKVAHPSQFRRYLAGGEFGSGKLFTTTEMSQSVNAIVACNGDYYSYRRKGITVTNGTVHKMVNGVADLCFIDGNGDMILARNLEFADDEAAQAYMDEHDINFSLAFGPILVENGEFVCPDNYALGEVKKGFPRAAICQMGQLHYLFAASNMEHPYYNNLTMPQFGEVIAQTGCIHAYTLDGGQTATVAMDSKLINHVNYGSERLISDIIYFATAKPAQE